jgi:hypothetical protein
MTKASKTKRSAKPASNWNSGRKSVKKAASAVTQVKETAMQALAGAAVGAVRAIIPPLEKAFREGKDAVGLEETPEGAAPGKAKR